MNILMLPVTVALLFSCGNNNTNKQTSAVTENTQTVLATSKKGQDSSIVVDVVNSEEVLVVEEIDINTENTIQEKVKTLEKETPSQEIIAMAKKNETTITKTEDKIGVPVSHTPKEDKEIVEEVIVKTTTTEAQEIKEVKKPKISKAINHAPWNSLLKKHVNDLGNVDYKSFAQDITALNAYLETLAQNTPIESAAKNEKLAYYINLYNAATVKLIIDNYPTKSIKSIKSPWGKKIVPIGNEKFSLGDIEHKILRKMNEPRIHFAINCASFSCPKLINKAFTANQMEQQLQQATIDFVNDSTRNIITADKIQLSEIFKWYKKDFTKKGTSLKDYINQYAKTTISANAKASYLKYDWSLNEAK